MGHQQGLEKSRAPVEAPNMLWLIQRDFLEGKTVQQMVSEALAPVSNPSRDPDIAQVGGSHPHHGLHDRFPCHAPAPCHRLKVALPGSGDSLCGQKLDLDPTIQGVLPRHLGHNLLPTYNGAAWQLERDLSGEE